MATNVNKKLEKLNILQWKVQGLRAKALEISSIFSKKKISVACLQMTLIGDSNWCPTKKYKLEKSPHIGGEQNRGVAILIHATLQYNRVPLHTTLEAAAITINSAKRYTICSVYLSPNANIDMEELKSLIRQLHGHSCCWVTSTRSTQHGVLKIRQILEVGLSNPSWLRSLWGCSTRGGLPTITSKQTPSQPLICAFAQLENFGISSWRWMRTYMGVTTFPSL